MKNIYMRKAFTLVEVLIVFIIILILTGALLLTVEKIKLKTDRTVDIANIRSAKSAAAIAYADSHSTGEIRYAFDGEKAIAINAGAAQEQLNITGYGKTAFGKWNEEYGAQGNPVSANGTRNYVVVIVKEGRYTMIWSDFRTLLEECRGNSSEWRKGIYAVKGNIYYYNDKGKDGYYIAVKNGNTVGHSTPATSAIFVEINSGKYITSEEMRNNIGEGDVYRDNKGDMYVWTDSSVPYYNIEMQGHPSQHPELWTKITRK